MRKYFIHEDSAIGFRSKNCEKPNQWIFRGFDCLIGATGKSKIKICNLVTEHLNTVASFYIPDFYGKYLTQKLHENNNNIKVAYEIPQCTEKNQKHK